jgi:hypothetical protein
MQQPIRLSDEEMSALYRAVAPIAVHLRDAFQQDLADELRRYPEIGPGLTYRAIVMLQRKYFDPPSFTNDIHENDLIERRIRLERVERGKRRW